MTVKELMDELQRRVDVQPELADAPVYIARESEAAELDLGNISVTDQVADADEGEMLEGLFLELTTWS